MLHLQSFRKNARGFSDLLPYAVLIDEGIILQKDNSFLAAFEFLGKDIARATDEELNLLVKNVASAIQVLETGFCIHVDAIRSYKKAYPSEDLGFFPDKITKLIDDERREFFGSDVCFSTQNIIAVTYKPSKTIREKDILKKGLEYFKSILKAFEDALSGVLQINRLIEYEFEYDENNTFLQSDLFTYITQCITGEFQLVRVPKIPMYLDSFLGNEDFIGGFLPKIGNKYIKTITIDGFPQESYSVMLRCFDSVPFELRFNTRYICLEQYDAVKEVEHHVKGWNHQVISLLDQVLKTQNPKINQDAQNMKFDAEEVKQEVQSGDVSVGYLSTTIIILDENLELLEEKASEVRRHLQFLGFTCRFEKINAIEAYLGSLPGNTYANLRRPVIKTDNLADLLPLSSVYVGEEVNPCPFYPEGSRPLAVVTTDNTTPFWFNIHNNDTAHTAILGPTGTGKSTLVSFTVAQFFGYKNAQVFAFDKGNSLLPLCLGANGTHYEIGISENLCFSPLQNIDESSNEISFCEEWISMLLELQGYKITPHAKNEIHTTMEKLSSSPKNLRTLSNFMYLVQDTEIKEAIKPYTKSGVYKNLVDANEDTLGLSNFCVFEMEEIMSMGNKILIPILSYIFHRIEKSLKGQPSLIVLDEAWVMLGHPIFKEKIREWLKVFRKANCGVVLATQSLSDLENSGIMDVIAESCLTKIFLANPNATHDIQFNLYRQLGLNSKEINIIAQARAKRDYYFTNSQGRRLIQLALGKKTLAFIGASDKESIARIKELCIKYGTDNWQEQWLMERGAI